MSNFTPEETICRWYSDSVTPPDHVGEVLVSTEDCAHPIVGYYCWHDQCWKDCRGNIRTRAKYWTLLPRGPVPVWSARYLCDGPGGHFWAESLPLARMIVDNIDHEGDWTITDTWVHGIKEF